MWLVVQAALASDVDLFDPAGSLPSGEGTLQGESTVLGPAGPSAALFASYARDPVVREFADGTVEAAVSDQLPLTLAGSWTVDGLLRASLLVPVYPWVSAPINDVGTAAFGNVRLQVAVPVWTSDDGRSSFGLVPRLGLPTGSSTALVGGATSAELVAAATTRLDDVGLLANLNLVGTPNRPLDASSAGVGSTLGTTVGAFWQANETIRVGGEADVDLGLAGGAGGTNQTGAAHAFVQSVLPSGLGLTGGVGSGMWRGVGSPAYRVFAAVTWTTVDRDPDRDGILGGSDACATVPEDADGWEDADGCPEDDNDGDGVVDGSDGCPDAPEDRDEWEDADGCPDPDNDADGLADAADACPVAAGSIEAKGCPDRDRDAIVDELDACPDLAGSLALKGCPDRDGDLVVDPRDLCPDAPIPQGVDPATSDGCPPRVVAVAPATVYKKGTEIQISDRIEFETGKAELRAVSLPTVDQVASILKDNPGITKVEVQGHTDNVGTEPANLKLSQDRAASVVDYLVSRGIARERLVAKGYGESAPMFSNKTDSGRLQNRRVQFLILEATVADAAVTPAPAPRVVAPVVVPPAPVVAPAPKVAPKPAVGGPPGTLEVVLPPDVWGTVQLDGEMMSKAAPFSGVSVPPGEHTIRVMNSRLSLDWTKTFTVAPGASIRLDPLGSGAAPAPAPAAPADDNPWTLDEDLDLENPWAAPDPAPAPGPAPEGEPAPAPKPPRKSKKR
jgi:OOP family OmpA-OmpF porin